MLMVIQKAKVVVNHTRVKHPTINLNVSTQWVNQQKIYISWNDFYYLLDQLIADIKADVRDGSADIKKVVGIANGGLHVSLPIAYALGVPHEQVLISRYGRDEPLIENINFETSEDVGGLEANQHLVVDDILDDGLTIKLFGENFLSGGFKIASLYASTWSSFNPDYCVGTKKDRKTWIIFPWEDE
jgi:hypoxanthine phosphoribosyltransferase